MFPRIQYRTCTVNSSRTGAIMDVVLVTVTAFMPYILLFFIKIILFYVPHIGF